MDITGTHLLNDDGLVHSPVNKGSPISLADLVHGLFRYPAVPAALPDDTVKHPFMEPAVFILKQILFSLCPFQYFINDFNSPVGAVNIPVTYSPFSSLYLVSVLWI